MDDLKMPQILPRFGVDCHHAGVVEIVAGTVAAPQVARGRAEWHINDSARDIDRHKAPDVDAAAQLPTIAGPGSEVGFAGPRDGVERPGQFAVMDVEGAHITRHAW